MSAIDGNIEIIKQTPYFFTDSRTNDMIMYTGNQTQHMLFGTTSNDSSIINLYNSNVTFNRLGNFSCNLTIGSNSYIGITNYVTLQTNIDFAALNSSNAWTTNHGGKALYMRYSTYSSNDASYIQSIFRDGVSTSMLDMQIQASNLHFCTGNTNAQIQATIKPDGKVGIGTSNPSENLHVKNNFRINGNIAMDSLMPIKFGSNVATNIAAQIGFNLINNSNFLDIIGGATATQTGRQIYFWIDSNQAGGVPGRATFEGGTVWLTTGSLGICRSNPVSLIHLTSNSSCYTTYTNTINSNTGVIMGIENNAAGGMIYNTSNAYLKFGTNNLERMKIQSNGYVGIGVSNPTSILHVHNPVSIENNIIHLTNSNTGSNSANGFEINLDTTKNVSFWNYENGFIRFATSNMERVKIITSTTKMLQVMGDIFVTNGGWCRIDGTNPLYFDTYGGGWYMNDSTWIKAYGDKNIYTGGVISTSNKLSIGVSNPNYLLEVKNTNGTGGWLSSFSNNSVVTLISDSTGNGLQVNTGQNSSPSTFAISLCNSSSNLFKITNNGVGILASNLTCTGLDTTRGLITTGTINCYDINTNNNSITCGSINSTSITTNRNTITSGSINCYDINTNNYTLTSGTILCSNINTSSNTILCGDITCSNLISRTINTNNNQITCGPINCSTLTTNGNTITSGTINCTNINTASNQLSCGTIYCSNIVANNNSITCGPITSGTITCSIINAGNNAITCGGITSTTINTNRNTITCGNIDCFGINTNGNSISCSNLTASNLTVTNLTATGDLKGNSIYINGTQIITSSRSLTNVTIGTNLLSGTINTNMLTGSISSSMLSGTISTSILPLAYTSTPGIVQLYNSTNSYSTTLAATANSVRQAYELASSASSAASSASSTANAALSRSGGTCTGLVTFNNGTKIVDGPRDTYNGVGNYVRCLELPIATGGDTIGTKILGGYGDIIIVTGPNSAPNYFNCSRTGTFYANAKSFKISHPTISNYYLYHASLEGPRYDLIYRGKSKLQNGKAIINACLECNNTGGMTPGTLNALGNDFDLFLQNKTSFSRLLGSYSNEIITVQCEDPNSEDEISWMLICERQDENIRISNITDSNGSLITEHAN